MKSWQLEHTNWKRKLFRPSTRIKSKLCKRRGLAIVYIIIESPMSSSKIFKRIKRIKRKRVSMKIKTRKMRINYISRKRYRGPSPKKKIMKSREASKECKI
jgi:hypothetical protein